MLYTRHHGAFDKTISQMLDNRILSFVNRIALQKGILVKAVLPRSGYVHAVVPALDPALTQSMTALRVATSSSVGLVEADVHHCCN